MKRIAFLLGVLLMLLGFEANANETIELSQASKDSIMYSKLSPEQLIELKKNDNLVELKRIEARSKDNMPFSQIGLVTIVTTPFIFVLVLIYMNVRMRNRESQRRYDIYMKSLEMGQVVPTHFFDEPERKRASNLKSGILWLAVGLALVLYFSLEKDFDALILGIVPAFVGAGYILVHWLDKPLKKQGRDE